MLPVSVQTLQFLKGVEGCRLKAYQDSRGIWTIGYGFTTIYGRPVKPSDTISQAQADWMLAKKALEFQTHVLDLVHVPLTANQLTALVSFAFNEGWGALAASTLLKKLNDKDYQGAANGFLQYTRAGNDRTILLPRRQKERSLFLCTQ